jgi:hypothetical protein
MSYLAEQNADTPLARWQFEEIAGSTIDDDQSVTHDGTITGTVTLNQPAVFPDGGLGADFDGSTGYVNIGNMSTTLGIGTVEAVVMFDTIPSGSNANPIFSHAWTSGQIIPLVVGFDMDNAHSGQLGVGYFTGAVWQGAYWTTAPTTGVPYHIVGKYDGTTLKLRVNGVEVATATPGTARPGAGSVNATAYIGRRWDAAQFHNGRVWDVALYGSALSDIRSDAHYLALANPFTDDFANAKAIAPSSTLSNIDTTAWTLEASEPGSMDKTGWATFTPAATDLYTLSTVGSNFDTKLAVYTGTALNNLVLVASDDNSGGSGTSRLQATLTSGTAYYVQVGAQPAGSGGLLSFSITQMADGRLAAIIAEVISDAAPIKQLTAVSAEVLSSSSNTIPDKRLSGLAVEVLTPMQAVFVGWGIPR